MGKHPTPRKHLRWECETVQMVLVPVKLKECQYLLETIATELYELSYQLQELSLNHASDTTSSLHPIENKQAPLTTSAEDIGDQNVNNTKNAA